MWIDTRPALRSRFSCARRVRISLARWSASIRCNRLRSGAAACLVGELVAGGIGARVYTPSPARQDDAGQIRLDVDRRWRVVEMYKGRTVVLQGIPAVEAHPRPPSASSLQ